MIFYGSAVYIGSAVPPKSSTLVLHMLFQDPEMGPFQAAAIVQIPLPVLQIF